MLPNFYTPIEKTYVDHMLHEELALLLSGSYRKNVLNLIILVVLLPRAVNWSRCYELLNNLCKIESISDIMSGLLDEIPKLTNIEDPPVF